MPATRLVDRGVLRVSGDDARAFLDNIVTNAMDPVAIGRAGYGGLLTPQGKIIADFIVVAVPDAEGGGFLLDTPLLRIPELMKKLRLYKLRAKVALDDLSEATAVIAAAEGGTLPADAGLTYADPRFAALGARAIVDREGADELVDAGMDDYHAHRIGLGIPDGGRDFAYGETFPHEALFDQLGGVSFRKGCYIGQEVVSRMQHRGTARSRIVPIAFDEGVVPEHGVEASADGKPIGRVGSSANGRGLALLRLDRVADALAAGHVLDAGGLAFTLAPKPAFIGFPYPGEAAFGVSA